MSLPSIGQDRTKLHIQTDLGDPDGVAVRKIAKEMCNSWGGDAALDVRAFMAARRAGGVSGRSLSRMLAALRSFAGYLERNRKGSIGALATVRAPKLAKTLPKALPIAAARRITEAELRAGEERAPWILARDAAVPYRSCRSEPPLRPPAT